MVTTVKNALGTRMPFRFLLVHLIFRGLTWGIGAFLSNAHVDYPMPTLTVMLITVSGMFGPVWLKRDEIHQSLMIHSLTTNGTIAS